MDCNLLEKNFDGKVVVITGSSSGIGAQTAIEFSRSGAQVVIVGRDVHKLSDVSQKCLEVSLKKLKALEVVADVSKDKDCRKIIDSTIEGFGRLDILVNNAGTGWFTSVYDNNILESFDRMVDTNLRSVVYLTHLSVKHLEKTKGNVVNVSSVSALRPNSRFGMYCMTKNAVNMFTKCAALELGPKGIRINCVEPAAVKTNFGSDIVVNGQPYSTYLEQRGKSYPLGRVGQPLDVANAILFLASDQCSWITGTDLLLDGGGRFS